MILHPSQSKIAKDTHRFRVVNCGRRFGKTSLAVQEMVAKAIAKDNQNIAYIAPTYQQARDIAWQNLKEITLPVVQNVNESRLEITLNTTKGGTSQISLRGWESVETLRGQRFDFLVVDEIASMRNWAVNWQEVLRPTLTDSMGDAMFISTPKGFNHFFDLYNKQDKDKDYKSFHFTSYDNPFLQAEEIDKAREEVTEDRFAQEYMADFRKTEGLVYKEFNRDLHLYEGDVYKVNETIAGIDFGYTNPAAVLHIKKDFDNTYWVSEEWYHTKRTEAQIADYVVNCKFNAVYPDPENPSAIEVLSNRGVQIMEVIKGKGSVQTGINKVRDLFKRNKIMIHKSCENLITELETYSYADKRPDHNEEEVPIKENDHALDALRYAIMTNMPEDHDHLSRMRAMHRSNRSNQKNQAR